jgi:hypothetical protein
VYNSLLYKEMALLIFIVEMEGISSLSAGERASLLGRSAALRGLASLVFPQESRRFPPSTKLFNRANKELLFISIFISVKKASENSVA